MSMEVAVRKKPITRTSSNAATASSVCDTRIMRIGQVKGSIKFFNGEPYSSGQSDQTEPQPSTPTTRLARAQAAAGKRKKTWRSESCVRSPSGNSSGKEGPESRNVSADGSKKTPVQSPRMRSQSDSASDRSPLQQPKKTTSGLDVVDGGDRNNSSRLRKTKPETGRANADLGSAPASKSRLEFVRVGDISGNENFKSCSGSTSGQVQPGSDPSGSISEPQCETDESRSGCESSGVVREGSEMIQSGLGNVGPTNSSSKSDADSGDADGADCDEDDDADSSEYDLIEDVDDAEEEGEEFDGEIEVEKQCLDVKVMNIVAVEEKWENEIKHVKSLKSDPRISTSVAKQPPPQLQLKSKTLNCTGNFSRPIGVSDECCQRYPETQSKLQTLVDLVMWRDVSRSAFVFGMGVFLIVSTSYTREIEISIVSVISYLGLLYLATTFMYRSILCRGVLDVEDPTSSNYLGEEEAIWLLRLLLPYVNELLWKIRGLFSGDPAVTMKVAVVLFVLARCGSSITTWKMVKLGFLGVFTLPRLYSSYSSRISAYGEFWVRRFRDAWQSCSHKKAVAFGVFTLFWNLSSSVARIWAAFMLFVAFRYYQQCMVAGDDWIMDFHPTHALSIE